MANVDFYIVLIIVTLFTIFFRISPIFFKIPEDNVYINTFFEYMPIAILTILALPDVFTSLGTSRLDIIVAILSSLYVIYMALKRKHIGLIIITSIIIVITLRGSLNGIL